MKDLIVYTDFSPAAKNAAEFAFRLAWRSNSGLVLCHAIVDCERKDIRQIKKSSLAKLCELKKLLLGTLTTLKDAPVIRLVCSPGSLQGLAKRIQRLSWGGISVLGVHHAGLMGGFGLGHRYNELTALGIPVILVPAVRIRELPSRIALVSDLAKPEPEAALLFELSPLIKMLHAALYIVHVNMHRLKLKDAYHRGNSILQRLGSSPAFCDIHLFSIEDRYLGRELEMLLAEHNIDLVILTTGGDNMLADKFLHGINLDGFYHARVPLFIFSSCGQFAC